MPDAYPSSTAVAPAPPGDEPATDPHAVFAAFHEASLWPGLGRTTGSRLAAAGITLPEHVDLGRLGQVEGVSGPRARRLADSFRAAAGTYAVVELLVGAGLPARLARAATERLGPNAADDLRTDPWALLLSLIHI